MFCEMINKNTWRCIADGPQDPITGKRKQISRRGKSKSEAKRRVLEAIEEKKKTKIYDKKIKFSIFSEHWLKQYNLRGNKGTTIEYREYCISILNTYLDRKAMTDIDTLELQNIFNELFNKGTARSTLLGIRNVAKMIFSFAEKIGLIENNPVEAVFVPKKQQTIEEINGDDISKLYLESNELTSFLSYVDDYKNIVFKTIIYLIAFTGMRPGEAIGLKYNDIDLENKTINIHKTVYAKKGVKGDFELTPPKTASSVRIVDIDELVVEKIEYLYKFRKDRGWKVSDFVFGDEKGVPPTVKLLNQAVRRIGAKTSIKKQFRTYILRHTHISLLAEAGVDLNYIMNRVGHKNSNTTTKIYLHVTSGMRKNASEKMHAKFTELLYRKDNKID